MERKHAKSLVARLVFATLEYDRYTGQEDDVRAEFEAAKTAIEDALSAVPVLPSLNGEPTRHYYFSPMRPLWVGFGSAIGNRDYQYTMVEDGRHFAVEGDPLPQETVESLELVHEGSTRSQEA